MDQSHILSIRVAAKTAANEYRVVIVDLAAQSFICDCIGTENELCAHVDAVIRCGERHMVHPHDRPNADFASASMAAVVVPPPSWKASWQRNKAWRGLPIAERRIPASPPRQRDPSKPLVAFTGQGPRSRTDYIEDARAYGWEVTNGPSSSLRYLIAGEDQVSNRKLATARRNGTEIVSYENWETIVRSNR